MRITTTPLRALLLSALTAPAVAGGAPAAAAGAQELAPTIVVTQDQAEAVEFGLAWLAANQEPNGSWVGKIGYKLNTGYDYTEADQGHVGVTALAGMAFMAGGQLPGRGEHGAVVERALDFVLGCVQDDGYITYKGTRMYSHAFATLFLAEIYGMTRRADVREKLQLAVDFIVNSQNKQGGWRYEPYAVEADMSIVVCQVLALRAARNIGIRVPRSVVDKAAQYVVDSAVTKEASARVGWYRNDPGSFHYQKQDTSRSSFPLTAAGVTALHGVGIYSDEAIEAGVDYLWKQFHEFNRSWGARKGGHYFFWYGHYYGVQAMYTAGGHRWENYYELLRAEILGMQQEDGSFPNRVGPGSAFGTACAVLILEIPYRFLPIFQR